MSLILGLDLGTNSVGWALMEATGETAIPNVVRDAGVRVFDAGTDGDIESGRDESRNTARREARQQRRQGERRLRRRVRLLGVLQRAGLLPECDARSPEARHRMLRHLDATLRREMDVSGVAAADHVFPYLLRARSLDKPLSRHALGRAFHHLGQRRGFLSNRKAARKEGEDDGAVKAGISELRQAMDKAGARTLGEYFAGLDPSDPAQRRIRERWTARDMYEDEFLAIWQAQEPHHPEVLTEELRDSLFEAIFWQRPLKRQTHLLGRCSLEPDRKRAPMGLLIAQRFRYLQRVNDLAVIPPDRPGRGLTAEERSVLLPALEQEGSYTFPKLRKLLGFKNTWKFNLEEGGEKKFLGNVTACRIREIFGEAWDGLAPAEQDRVVEDLLTIEDEKSLARRGMKAWGLDETQAEAFARLQLEDSYVSLSRQALARVVPELMAGKPYATVRKELYGDEPGYLPVSGLPRLDEAPFELRNPVVHRTLVEMRKVVNAIIRRHGKPDIIRVELARDMKRSKKDRQEMSKQNRDNQKKREKAMQRIFDEMGDREPSRNDVLKVLLADECNWECPYTGKRIRMQALIGDHPQFDIEHIIPFSRSLDDSYMNKTLCYHEENRSVKRNKTPFEAYSGAPEWDEVIARVGKFNGSGRAPKLRRFLLEDLESLEGFSSRQLNDTRYASRLAAQYLGLLYGKEHRHHVQVSAGKITAELRKAWRLNSVLNDGGEKTREDHRHHAIDAIVTCLATPAAVRRITDAALDASKKGHYRWWKLMQPPWEGFLDDVRAAVDAITVSHRAHRKVNGPLHEETIYSRAKPDAKGNSWVHVRKPLAGMSRNEVEAIVDPAVRALVLAKLAELGQAPDKAFADPAKLPRFVTADGREIPIKRARTRKRLNTFAVGKGPRAREVVPASNHHMEVFRVVDKGGKVKYTDRIVSQYEAVRRLRKHEPVVDRHMEGGEFVCSLCGGDCFQLPDEDGEMQLMVVRGISKDIVTFVPHTDARLKKTIVAAKEWSARRVNPLLSGGLRKVQVNALGELRPAND